MPACSADTAHHIEFLHVAELVFFSGTMDCGKSTLALQMDHNHAPAAGPG